MLDSGLLSGYDDTPMLRPLHRALIVCHYGPLTNFSLDPDSSRYPQSLAPKKEEEEPQRICFRGVRARTRYERYNFPLLCFPLVLRPPSAVTWLALGKILPYLTRTGYRAVPPPSPTLRYIKLVRTD